MYHIGINLGHDRSAAIVRDGKILSAIHQERLDRCKHSIGYLYQNVGDDGQIQLPHEAIQYCMQSLGISFNDIETITANMPGIDKSYDILLRQLPAELKEKIRKAPSHHLLHAYTAFWPSGFSESPILVVDASGSTYPDGTCESYSLFKGEGTRIAPIHSERVPTHLAGLSTLGFVYEYITRKAGFITRVGESVSIPEAGKLMGLAPYGTDQKNWREWFHINPKSYHIEINAYDIFLEIAAIEKKYDDHNGKPYLRAFMADLAYKVQKELEKALLHLARLVTEETKSKQLSIAGGVGLNSVANYKILRKLQLDDIFIFPSAGDAGIAAGAALWAYATSTKKPKREKLSNAFLVKTYSKETIESTLKKFDKQITVGELSYNEIIATTAKMLSKGHIIARFEKGSEFGPRALGNRSIIVDPSFPQMRDVLNARVKFREAFRPFAPVIPESKIDEVFEQKIPSPFMLVVSNIRKKYHSLIPSVTHVDGTGRVQSVTKKDNPFFHDLCFQIKKERKGPPVLLNTSFNIAGQPIVETPEDALETFLATDIDYLVLENFWISKKHASVKEYDEHISLVKPTFLPKGLLPDQSDLTDMMTELDKAFFYKKNDDCPWTHDELLRLSSEGARFREKSKLFQNNPYRVPFKSELSPAIGIIFDPLGRSQLANREEKKISHFLTWEETNIILALVHGSSLNLSRLRLDLQYSTEEWESLLTHWQTILHELGVKTRGWKQAITSTKKVIKRDSKTFSIFENENVNDEGYLRKFRNILHEVGYREATVCKILKVETLQDINPTHYYYYDKYVLDETPVSDCIRLFLIRAAIPLKRLEKLITDKRTLDFLKDIGLFIQRGLHTFVSRVDIYHVDDLYIVTDHRYLLFEEDKLSENAVMYIGADSLGLVHTAPRYPVGNILDLCTGSGIQALVASRYGATVIGVDINPRAIRFARFNAVLNGIHNVQFIQSNLFEKLKGKHFDTILANPPFVPSPRSNVTFRDGGKNGEEILVNIIKQSKDYLTDRGKLHIVTDLVETKSYEKKLKSWWSGGRAHRILLQTADRDEILFSVPHSHLPFGQSYESYTKELGQWIENFRKKGLKKVNFGYILIHKTKVSNEHYLVRTINNPHKPIHHEVKNYCDDLDFISTLSHKDSRDCSLKIHESIRLRQETGSHEDQSVYEIVAHNNPFFTTYKTTEEVFHIVTNIIERKTTLHDFMGNETYDIVIELLNKGILKIVKNSKMSQDRAHTPLPLISSPKNNLVTPLPLLSPKKIGEPLIREMETKTTPTCLSSYITTS